MRHNANLIGPNVAKFRCLRGWTQEDLAGKIQLAECYMTRETLANIETRRRAVNDIQAGYIADALGVSIVDLYPPKPWHGARRLD
jgi:transcriptional regulator with XRE-family HTH domain